MKTPGPPLPFPIHRTDDNTDPAKVGISVGVDKASNAIVMQFGKQVTWISFDAVTCASVMKLLGEKLKELQEL